MDKQTADKLYEQYQKYDEAFRAAKKAGNFRRASEMKAKRDAINLVEVLEARRG